MCFAFFRIDESQMSDTLQRVYEAQSIIAYLYGTPDQSGRPFLPSDQMSVYVFEAGVERAEWTRTLLGSPPKRATSTNNTLSEKVDWYEGRVNWSHDIFATKSSRIYPEKRHLGLNITQTLNHDLFMKLQKSDMWAFQKLVEADKPINVDLEKQIFIAINWFNRSNRLDQPEDINLVFLAIAFESLLNLENGPEVTKRFKETVITLLGPIPRLEEWLEAFYRERSKIVHEGLANNMEFKILEGKSSKNPLRTLSFPLRHRPLTSYGYVIFRLCLNAILSGHQLAESFGLREFLRHNQERLEDICQLLKDNGGDPIRQIEQMAPLASGLTPPLMTFDEVNPETLSSATKAIAGKVMATPAFAFFPSSIQAWIEELHSDTSHNERLHSIANNGSIIDEIIEVEMPRNYKPIITTFHTFLDYAQLAISITRTFWHTGK